MKFKCSTKECSNEATVQHILAGRPNNCLRCNKHQRSTCTYRPIVPETWENVNSLCSHLRLDESERDHQTQQDNVVVKNHCPWHNKQVSHNQGRQPLTIEEAPNPGQGENTGKAIYQYSKIIEERTAHWNLAVSKEVQSAMREWPSCPYGKVNLEGDKWKCTCENKEQ